MQDKNTCCNQDCNQGRECPVRAQQAEQAVSVADERAAFEAWWSTPHLWSNGHKEAQWNAWQARAALSATPAAAKDHELIDWDSAHKIAFQAAAAFRPSYFNGAGFMAHTWVVEAIRSGHIDGQRHARGLPPIDRSGAHAAELRMDRKAATPAAAPVVLPEPEAAIREVMELVNTLIASINEGHHANSEGWRDGCFQAADNTHKTIESKLRALLAGVAAPAAQEVRQITRTEFPNTPATKVLTAFCEAMRDSGIQGDDMRAAMLWFLGLEEAAPQAQADAGVALTPTTQLPGGWVMAPVNPTDAMIRAGEDAENNEGKTYLRPAWRYMLAAAPKAEPAPAADALDAAQINAAAKEMTKRLDYPWEFMTDEGRESMRENVRCAFAAAMSYVDQPTAAPQAQKGQP